MIENMIADTWTVTIGDLMVNRLGFGAMRITGEGVWGPPSDPEECKRVLRRAVELGVNFIDTADSYGPNVSETLVAEALHPYPDDLVIATKAGLVRPSPGKWVSDGRPEHIREAVEGSLQRLRLERLDLYQVHRPDPGVPYEETIGAFKDLQAEGKIRHVGVSNVDLGQLATARSLVDVVSVQNRYNLTDRKSENVVDACEAAGLAFIPWFPLATGRLAGSALEGLATRMGVSPMQLGLAWLLHRSPVMLPIPGTSSVAHLEENLGAAAIRISSAEMEELEVP